MHVPLAIEQGRYVCSGRQIVMRAGHLVTSDGTAVYIGLARTDGNHWQLSWTDERPSMIELLLPAELGTWPVLDPRLEIVLAGTLPLKRRRSRPCLSANEAPTAVRRCQ